MTPERYQRAVEVFNAAVGRDPNSRAMFVAEACAGDDDLRRDVERMLAADARAGFLEKPLNDIAADLISDSTRTVVTAGDQFGPYRIEGSLGAGGMGEVFQAVDTRLGRKVAIKISAEQFSGRFEREARAISALNHSNICTLYDIGPNYLVMELVEGETLAARLKKGAISAELAIQYGAQIADALAAAHAKSIIHRDLKPGNIMLAKNGVKVLDFGLAKSAQDESITQSHAVMGTPAYMAPEQYEGKDADARTDIYALGLVLHEMATGTRRISGQAPPTEKLSPQLGHVIERCLAPEPDDRWQSASDVKKELEWARKFQLPAQPKQPRRSRLIFGAALFALACLGLLLVRYREKPPVQQSLRYEILTPGTAPALYPALSPDGRHLAFVVNNGGLVVNNGGPFQLWVRSLDTLESRALADTDGATYPFWSPDGEYLGFFAAGKLKKIAIAGGPPQTLCDATIGRGGTWNRDGLILFSPGPASVIFRVPAAGGTPVPVTKLAGGGSGGHRFPVFLPDGVHFLYTAGSDKPADSGVFVGSLDGTASVRLLPDVSNALYAPPAAPRTIPYVMFRHEGTLMALAFDAKALKTTGDMFPVVEQVPNGGQTGFGAFSVSENGMLVYHSGNLLPTRELVWMDRAGKHLGTIGKPATIGGFVLAPDGRTAAVSIADGVRSDIWLQDMARGVLSRFTFRSGVNRNPVWSPDGSRLILASEPSGAFAFDIYQKPVGGNGQEELLLHGVVGGWQDDWSPDGKWIIYQQVGQATRNDLWLLPLQGDRKPVVYLQTPFDETNARFSPDGRWVAYDSNESGRFQVYVQTFPASGSKYQISSAGGTQPSWRRDGKELFYVSADQKLTAVPIKLSATVEAGTPQPLFPVFPLPLAGYTAYASHDGQHFLLSVPVASDAPRAQPLTILSNWQTALKK